MIERAISPYLLKASKAYPVITVTGPRQSGKTTLIKHLFPHKPYVSLEDWDERELALADPKGFLNKFPQGAIIDEAQHVPSLFSYIQTRVDVTHEPGQFILSGSQNFLLLENITQSLAGRTAVIFLLPLSHHELVDARLSVADSFHAIFKGFYPRLYQGTALDSSDWHKNYILTYLERDVRHIKQIEDLSKFQLFLRLCAGRVGQLLNVSSLANECGIAQNTVKSWLGILEASFIVFLLKPYHKNFNKRLVKQPKLYFYDTGIACHLLGIQNTDQLATHYQRGNLFENFVVLEMMKTFINQGKTPALYFWRDNHGREVDLIIEQADQQIPIEIKSSQTFSKNFTTELDHWCELSAQPSGYVVYGGEQSHTFKKHHILTWRNFESIIVDNVEGSKASS